MARQHGRRHDPFADREAHAAALPLAGNTVVADRGMVSQATLNAFEDSDPPVRYIVGVRMRRQKEARLCVLESRLVRERSGTQQSQRSSAAQNQGAPTRAAPRQFVPTKCRGRHPSLVMSPVKRINEYD